MKRDDAIKLLADNLLELRNQYNVADLSIFGSVARNQAAPDSDIDLLVDLHQHTFDDPAGLYRPAKRRRRW